MRNLVGNFRKLCRSMNENKQQDFFHYSYFKCILMKAVSTIFFINKPVRASHGFPNPTQLK